MGVQIPPLPFTLIPHSEPYNLKTNYKLRGNQKLYPIGISDIRWGSEQFNLPYLNHFADILDNIKSDYRLYLGGDLVEAASKAIGNSAFHTTMDLNQQIREVIRFFKPYKKNIVVSILGNHEARLTKEHDFNPMEVIADALGCPVANQYFDTFYINQEPFTVYIKHGKGSSAHAHTAQGKTIRETQTIDADLYFEGHNHRLDFFSQPIRTVNGLKRKYYAFMGSFLSYNGYPDSMALPLLPEAFQLISVNKDRIVRNTPYFIDQVRPDLFQM